MTSSTTDYLPTSTAGRIIGIARQLFMQRGYRGVSINDIVQAAEVTKPTLYYHFADKEDLYAQMALQMLRELHERVAAAMGDRATTAARLTAMADVMLNSSDGDTRMMQHEIREYLRPELQQQIGEAFYAHMFAPLVAEMQRGLDRSELSGFSADQLARLYLAFMEGFFRHTGNSRPHDAPYTTDVFTTETIIGIFMHGAGHAPAAS